MIKNKGNAEDQTKKKMIMKKENRFYCVEY